MAKAQKLLAELGIDLTEALAAASRPKTDRPVRLLSAVMHEFLQDRLRAGIRGSSVRWYSTRLSPLFLRLGNRDATKIERADLRETLDRLPVGPSTRNNYARAWRAVWRWGLRQEVPIFDRDITEGLAPLTQKRESDGAEFLTVEDAERIMRNLPEQYRPAAAILLFAGVRPQEIWGLDKEPLLWRHVFVDERYLKIPAAMAKTREGRIIEGLPETLWRWIPKAADAPDKPVCPAQSQYLIRAIQIAGGFYKRGYGRAGTWEKLRHWPHDATRHSFATYALALSNDAAKVALWLGHKRDSVMLFKHYRGLTTRAEAERYFAIAP